MDKLLSLVDNNNVTFLQNPSNREIQDIIKNLYNQECPRIVFTAIHKENLMGLHAQLNYKRIENQLMLSKERMVKNILLCDRNTLYRLYTADNNLADIIIFYDSEVDNKEYKLIWEIWKKSTQLRKPRLLLLSRDYQLISCPFEKNKDNSYTFKNNRPEIEYSVNNYPRNSKHIIKGIMEKMRPNSKGIFQEMILVPHKRFLAEMTLKLREKFKNYEIYSFDENIYQSYNGKIFSEPKKHRIIVTLHTCSVLLDFKDLYYIYDSCQLSSYFFGNYQIYNISKKTGDKVASEAIKKLYRICSQDFYDKFNLVEKSYINNEGIAKLLLTGYSHDINLEHDKENIELLERLNLIKAGKVTKKAKVIADSPLGIRASNFIYEWGSKKLPLFPAIVLAVIIDQCKNNLVYIPLLLENKVKDKKINKGEENIITYMNFILSFISTFKDIDVEKEKIENWCQKNSIHINTFIFLIVKLKEAIYYCRKFLNFDLGLYESKNVLKKALPLLCSCYSEKIYSSHDKINHIYHDNKGVTAILDKHRFTNGNFIFPEKFISLYELNNNFGHNIVLFYIIIEE